MKKHRALLFILLVLLLVISTSTGLLVREYRQEQRNRALLAAVKRYDSRAALMALKAGADVNARDYGKTSPSFREMFQRLLARLAHANATPTAEEHDTALGLLFRQEMPSGYEEGASDPADNPQSLVSLLLQYRADVNAQGNGNVTPLMLAARMGFHTSVHDMLKCGGNVKMRDAQGRTALHWAANTNDAATARLILAGGADVNARDKEQTTPLMIAAEMEQRAMVQTLLEYHADATAKNQQGEDAFTISQMWIKNWMSPDDIEAIHQMLQKAMTAKNK